MTTKDKIIIAVVVVAGLALLAIDGLTGKADCGDARYDQTTGECRESK